ncbi:MULTISPECIES: hypothetical protein [Arthrobacter]|uniref:Uncharacterized protein n=1 Tax=Arthrobacter terricola TaxID=2547396 RepID=A0A4R5K808_9MICC|nr:MULTISPECIES: hypothetical protein [Arthrobacter]MBT8163177.1 hypothetical protein [Arthrobacter sp. GN70]TDF91253.1 hypothetical protein E1809_21050 [Arthrobacter terricola]
MTEQKPDDPNLVEEQLHEEMEQHPLSIWTRLAPGGVVSFRALGGQDYVGTVESKTSNGLIIWIRDDLNERRIFHFSECQSVRVLQE